MFSSPSVDKENVLEEIFATTPGRAPLKTVQKGSIAAVGTPLGIAKRTPRPGSAHATTPSFRRLARRLKRQSVPFALSKPVSIFDNNGKGIFTGNPVFEEGGQQLKRNGPGLNEMIQDKVSETVIKIRERYEATLAQKQHDLDEKNIMISQLQSEISLLKHSHNDSQTQSEKVNQDLSISNFVNEVISKAAQEIQNEDSTAETCDLQPSSVDLIQNTSPVKLRGCSTAITPTKLVSAGTSPIKLKLTENETSMTPVLKIHEATSVTPVGTADAMLATSPACLKDAGISTSPFCLLDSTTNTSHNCSLNSVQETSSTSTKSDGEHKPYPGSKGGSSIPDGNDTDPSFNCAEETAVAAPIKPEQDFGSLNVSSQRESCGTPLSSIHITDADNGHAFSDNTLKEIGTSMTPVTLIHKHTLVSPVQTSNVSISTSPLVAALHPEIITSLPLSQLRSELESAAISNELLRSECDELSAKIELLQSSVDKARSEAERKCSSMQNVVDSLTKKLEEALELNEDMERKKPLNAEEYDKTISSLQKDILLKEKQMTFYIKKASEADNLQKDLRRMYAKYNAQHQSYMTMEEETKKLSENYSAKCVNYDALQSELCDVKVELQQALQEIEAHGKVREEAKEHQVRCSILEEQIQTFQCQQRENLEFLEQERKGLEETSLELEQQVKRLSEELSLARQAFEEKSRLHEDTSDTVRQLRSQLSDVQDELNAVQSQAYLLMLEQEKELTAASRVLEDTWERLVPVVETYKERAKQQEEPTVEKNSEEILGNEYRPSFVYSVLAAVSGSVPTSENVKNSSSPEDTTEDDNNTGVVPCEEPAVDVQSHEGEDFTLVSRAKAFQTLLSDLEGYVQDGNEHAQMTIQRQVDEIANLEESLLEAKQQQNEQLTILKQELENEACGDEEIATRERQQTIRD
ncbi:myosin heavy chain, non-muscle-like [Dendronephthya gigantea]|uniref:myosin heavy chain, non-muscle-like n=1 Tax=Dendronephthya gigantea TaxID=151771 RepID=UPI00106C0CAF|nr:myosin heavy chain, non-muscle-like [Dendronephthya gigantea]